MFIAPLLVLIVLAILFPRVTKFVLTLCFFGVLFIVASVIDHARAGEPQEAMLNNAVAFANCTRGNALSEPGKLHQIKMLGGDETGILVSSCGALVDSYVHFCQASGYAEDHCYGDLRTMAEDALRRIGD